MMKKSRTTKILASLNEMIEAERFRKLHWEGTFEDYLSMVSRNPRLACCDQRIFDMVMSFWCENFMTERKMIGTIFC
jgi:hypothetical protein